MYILDRNSGSIGTLSECPALRAMTSILPADVDDGDRVAVYTEHSLVIVL